MIWDSHGQKNCHGIFFGLLRRVALAPLLIKFSDSLASSIASEQIVGRVLSNNVFKNVKKKPFLAFFKTHMLA